MDDAGGQTNECDGGPILHNDLDITRDADIEAAGWVNIGGVIGRDGCCFASR